MATDPISTAYFPSFCVSVCVSSIVAKQRLGKNVTAATNTQCNTIVKLAVYYAVHVVSKESCRLILPGTSCYTLIFMHVNIRLEDTRFWSE
jgi:hypothetical protein